MRYFIHLSLFLFSSQGCGNQETVAKEENAESSATTADGKARGKTQASLVHGGTKPEKPKSDQGLSPGVEDQAPKKVIDPQQAAGSGEAPSRVAPLSSPAPVPAPVAARGIQSPRDAGRNPATVPARGMPAPRVTGEMPAVVATGGNPAPVAARGMPASVRTGGMPARVASRSTPPTISTRRDLGVAESEVQLSPGRSVIVRGSIFQRGNQNTNFSWMIDQAQYARTLFVFNDNERQFIAFMNGDTGGMGCGAGDNNGAIRPYQCRPSPRAAGVPTGPGYTSLTPHVRAQIDRAIVRIRELAISGNFDTIIFSQSNDPSRPTLGIGIFAVGMEVRDYIFYSLLRLAPGV